MRTVKISKLVKLKHKKNATLAALSIANSFGGSWAGLTKKDCRKLAKALNAAADEMEKKQ